MVIRNRDELLSHGHTAGRRTVLDILDAGLAAADPYENVHKLVHVEGRRLIVGCDDPALSHGQRLEFDLDKVGRIFLCGGGKAAQRMAHALEDILGDLIAGGHVNAKKGEPVLLRRVGLTMAGHPLPDEDSVEGSRRIMEVLTQAGPGDIVFYAQSGGGSALLTLPAPGITLDDLRELNRVLYFQCGATMPDINAVRNMCVLLRSRECRYTGQATYIEISTEERPPEFRQPNGQRKVLSPLTVAQAYDHAIDTLHAYGCWDRVPEAIRRFLLARDPRYGPLQRDEVEGRTRYWFTAMGPEYMLAAAKARARELGLNAAVLASSLTDVEARPAGDVLGWMAHEIAAHNEPLRAPAVLLSGGELLVTVGDGDGLGGRNQEFILSLGARIAGNEHIVAGAADSDGTDGPTTWAGGLVDGATLARAEAAGFDVARELRRHNSHAVLRALGDAIYTGARGTNVQDLRVVYVAD